jgi:putative peptidoglycan lipid II flippase
MVSRALGVIRESVLTACFPAAWLDLWVVAFTIPNTLRGLLAEGAASAAFVPVYCELRTQEGEARARVFYARSAGAMVLVLAIVSLVGVLAAPAIVLAFASGYLDDPDRYRATVALARVAFPYIFFMGMAALSAGALQAHRSFAVPALAPALLNVALIAAPFTLVPTALALGMPPIGALGIGALIGGALQVVAQWPALIRIGLFVRPQLAFGDPAVGKAVRLLGPVAVGLGIYQLNLMLSRTLASWLPEGAQTYLWLGQRLVEVPQGMFAMAVATAALPALADLRARGEVEALRRTFRDALCTMLFVALPVSVLLVTLAEPLVAVLFQRGAFTRAEAVETARSLAWQAAGVWAIASVRVVVPVFHAHGDTRTPVVASALNLATFAALAIGLRGALGHVAIALAMSGAGAVQLGVLLTLLRRHIGRLGLLELLASGGRTAAASAVMAATAMGIASLGHWDDGADARDVAVLAAALACAALAFSLAAWASGSPELRAVAGAVRRRVHRERIGS